MVAAILSQDILAICLLFADGDMDVSLEEVIQRAEEYQEMQDRHFGISRSDFRGLFNMLLSWELGIKKPGDKMDDTRLSDVVTDILDYHDAYFNDEGESWTRSTNAEFDDWYGYEEGFYKQRMVIKEKMKVFFQHKKDGSFSQNVVKRFMEEIHISKILLDNCSRPGESS